MIRAHYRVKKLLLNNIEIKDVIEVSDSIIVSKETKISPKIYLYYKLKDGTEYNLIGWNFTAKLNPNRYIISVEKDEYTIELETLEK